MKIGWISFWVLFILLSCEKPVPSAVSLTAFEQEVFESVNAYRELNGLENVALHHVVQNEAEAFADAMANGEAEFSSDGFADRALSIKSSLRGSDAAECIARDFDTSFSLMNYWINAPVYSPKLLGNFNTIGIASRKSSVGVYYHVLILFRTN